MKILILSLVITTSASITWWGRGHSDEGRINLTIKRSIAESSDESGRIRRLNVSGENLKEIKALARLANIEDLDLSDNNIRDVSALSGFGDLVVLDLSHNQITDLTPLKKLKTKLRKIIMTLIIMEKIFKRWVVN